MRTETIEWESFMEGSYRKPSTLEEIVKHVERNKMIYQVAGITLVIMLNASGVAFADTTSVLDAKAKAIYFGKLIGFGKWAIIIKAGWDTINKTIREDFDGAKRSFLSYLMVYVLLWALPWSMDQVGDLFKS